MEVSEVANTAIPSRRDEGSAMQFVTFTVAGGRYALSLYAVERVEPVVHITPLPKAPEIVLGIMNLEGRIIPVVDTRRRLGYAGREILLSDKLIVAATSRRPVALLVDRVDGLVKRQRDEITPAQEVLNGIGHVRGVLKLDDGLVLINDLNTFLSLEEEQQLREALKSGPATQ